MGVVRVVFNGGDTGLHVDFKRREFDMHIIPARKNCFPPKLNIVGCRTIQHIPAV